MQKLGLVFEKSKHVNLKIVFNNCAQKTHETKRDQSKYRHKNAD